MKTWLITLAVFSIVCGLVMVIVSHLTPPIAPIPFPPPSPPFKHFIAAVGLLEPSSDEIFIGTPFGEIVEEVHVDTGDYVLEGAPLFTLNTSSLKAQLMEKIASLEVATAHYNRQLELPREESIPPQKAIRDQFQANYLNYLVQYERALELKDPRAISQDEFSKRKYSTEVAKYQLDEAQANLDLLLAGAWIADLEIYRAQKKEAEHAVAIIQDLIDRSTIRAPFNGFALQINIHEGEYAQAAELPTPLIIFGTLDPLNIRIDIDEEDVWRMIPGAPAMAYVRGNSRLSSPLVAVDIEPYMIAKQTLSGKSSEIIDTRVLQVIYEVQNKSLPIYPGQLMDVYLEAKPYEESP